MALRRLITLTSDFGLEDGYVGTMKGVILGINPQAAVVDLCHNVAPQDVTEAAFILGTSYRYFPANTIHLAVVDPGVGAKRRALVVESSEGTFVGPDNGILTWAASGVLCRPRGEGMANLKLSAVSVTNPRYCLARISRTFHARDIFAPTAAHLSLGTPPSAFGEAVDDITWLPLLVPKEVGPATLVAHVIHVDRFGNLITDLSEADVERLGGDVVLEIAGQRVDGLSDHYAAKDGTLALVGSSGFVEVAVRDGSAAQLLGAGKGDNVLVCAKRGEAYA